MMKKMRLFRRITATAMVFAMVGITSAFAASSESYGSMTNGKGEIDHIILNDVLPEEEKLSTKSSASPDTEMVISDSPTNGNGEIKHSDRKIKADIRKKLLISAVTILILIAVCVIATVFLQKWGGVSIDTLTTEQSIVEDNDNTDEFNFIT